MLGVARLRVAFIVFCCLAMVGESPADTWLFCGSSKLIRVARLKESEGQVGDKEQCKLSVHISKQCV